MKNYFLLLVAFSILLHTGLPVPAYAGLDDLEEPNESSQKRGLSVQSSLSNSPSPKEIIPPELMDKSGKHGKMGGTMYSFGATQESSFKYIQSLLDLGIKPTVLEIGCGTGILSFELAKSFNGKVEVYANDLYSENLAPLITWRNSLDNTDPRKKNTHLIPGDATKLQNNPELKKHFPNNLTDKFDVVFCARVIHFLSPEAGVSLLGDLYNYVKKDGHVYVVVKRPVSMLPKEESFETKTAIQYLKLLVFKSLTIDELEGPFSREVFLTRREKKIKGLEDIINVNLDFYETMLTALKCYRTMLLWKYAKQKNLFFPGYSNDKIDGLDPAIVELLPGEKVTSNFFTYFTMTPEKLVNVLERIGFKANELDPSVHVLTEVMAVKSRGGTHNRHLTSFKKLRSKAVRAPMNFKNTFQGKKFKLIPEPPFYEIVDK